MVYVQLKRKGTKMNKTKKINQEIYESDMDVDEEFIKATAETKKKKSKRITKDLMKYVRLLQIAVLILATLLLARQSFLYSWVMAVGVGATTAERIWVLVFRGN